jgi:hypothetical protein
VRWVSTSALVPLPLPQPNPKTHKTQLLQSLLLIRTGVAKERKPSPLPSCVPCPPTTLSCTRLATHVEALQLAEQLRKFALDLMICTGTPKSFRRQPPTLKRHQFCSPCILSNRGPRDRAPPPHKRVTPPPPGHGHVIQLMQGPCSNNNGLPASLLDYGMLPTLPTTSKPSSWLSSSMSVR